MLVTMRHKRAAKVLNLARSVNDFAHKVDLCPRVFWNQEVTKSALRKDLVMRLTPRIGFALVPTLIIGLLTLAGCSNYKDHAGPVSTLSDDRGAGEIAFAQNISIVDSNGQSIPYAKIQIGAKADDPFTGNIMTADANGLAALPAAWKDSQPVTISVAGFVQATYFGQTPQALQFHLHAIPAKTTNKLTGVTTGYGSLPQDDIADVALVYPAITRPQVFTLSVSDLISPESDTITIFGQDLQIPSNVAIPTQTENYIFDITLDKPIYRVFMPPGTWKIASAHVQFPFHATVDAARAGKTFMELIGFFNFREISSRDIIMTTPSQTVNIPVNTIPLAKNVSVTVPKYSSSYTALVAAMNVENGLYTVTDIKAVPSGSTMKLSGVKNRINPAMAVAALRRAANANATIGVAAEELSTVIWSTDTTFPSDFLPLVNAPAVSGQSLTLAPPAASASLEPIMTTAVLMSVEQVGSGQVVIEKKTPQWEIYSAGWPSTLALPDVTKIKAISDDKSNDDQTSKAKLRWQSSFAAGPVGSAATSIVGPQGFEKASHVTRNAVDL
jgi:hypothetical protein